MPSRNALLFSRRPDTAKAWDISPTQWYVFKSKVIVRDTYNILGVTLCEGHEIAVEQIVPATCVVHNVESGIQRETWR